MLEKRLILAKKKEGMPRREVTKRQLARWQQQRKRQRIIFGLGILVIVAVVVVMGAGWYLTEFQPLRETVIKVNDTEFDMNYYVKALEFYAADQPVQFLQFVADSAVEDIQQSELLRQEALKLGITASDEAVDEELKSRDLPVNQVSRDIIRAQMLRNKLHDEYFEQQLPVFAEQRHLLAMFLESDSQVGEVLARLENGEDFVELASELSLDDFSKANQGDLGWRPKGILTDRLGSSIPEEYAFSAEVGVFSQPLYDEAKYKQVGYWLIKLLERKEDQQKAHIKGMLLVSREQADEVRAKLEADESFSKLTREFSQDEESKEDGGDLGWPSPGMMSAAVDEFAFDPEVEPQTLSEPIRDDTEVTVGGYWLLKVADMDDNRKIDDEDRDFLKAKAFYEWFSALWDSPENKIESYLDGQQKEWAILRVIRS